jgi:HlyD family secretion protein
VKNELFRKEAVEKITSPEDLNAYVKVLNPRVWLILLGIGIAIAGLVIFTLSTGFPIGDLFFGGGSAG